MAKGVFTLEELLHSLVKHRLAKKQDELNLTYEQQKGVADVVVDLLMKQKREAERGDDPE